MIEPFLEEGAWCYWVVSIGALLTFLGLVVACICSCRRNENKSTGANRSLPDIPKDKDKRERNVIATASQDIYETTENIGDHSELYATVRDTAAAEQAALSEEPEVSHPVPLRQSNSGDQYSGLPSSPNNSGVEHPYAQLQSVQKLAEGEQSSRAKQVNQTTDAEKPSTSAVQIAGNPVAPPRTRRTSSHNSLLSVENSSCDIQAANAISGGIQANQELPYMTPPLLMLLPQPPQPLSNTSQQHFSGDSQDSKGYTSISVREPLANIIAQTKTICRQNQSTRALTDPHYATVSDDSDEMYAAIDEQEKVYTSGSETYAQIQPTIVETQRVQNEQALPFRAPSRIDETYSAPQPPSVDSLRHVAHAHSRQASSSSANSSIINPGSPKPEKRQANSPLPPPPEGMLDVYASIDKRTRNEDRTKSSLSSGKSLEDMYAKVMKKKKDVDEQHADGSSNPQSETLAGRKASLVDVNRISWSSHDSMEAQKRESDLFVTDCGGIGGEIAGGDTGGGDVDVGDGSVGDNRKLDSDVPVRSLPSSVIDDDQPGSSSNFPLIHRCQEDDSLGKDQEGCEPNYEVLRPQQRVTDSVPDSLTINNSSGSNVARRSTEISSSSLSSYAAPSFKHRQISNASSEDPGYEKVRLKKRVEVDQDTDSEPNYESMPHDAGEPNYASVCRPGDSDTDPNYESVNHEDPNYESVKYMSISRTEEPPYEQVNVYKSDQDPDGYEKVKKQALNIPGYERISRQDYSTCPINGDTDDEQYVQV